MLAGFLGASRAGAVAAHGVEVEPGVLEVVVSRWALPTRLGFDPSRIPGEPHRVYVGQLMDGSDGVWDLVSENHGLVVGQVGSGKSKTVEMLLVQFAVKGWRVLVVTPKLNEPIFAPFATGPHRVITGIDDHALELVVELFRAERADRTERQKLQAEYGAEWWHQVPPEVLAERPMTLLVVDESRSYFLSHAGESKERKALKSEITFRWNEWIQEGRSAGHHGLVVSQSVAVDGLGGGFVDDNLGLRVGVRRLARKWHPVMFPETGSDAPSLLVNPATPPGRAVARGLVAPTTVFGAEAVNDAPMQIPLLDPDVRDGLLDGSILWGPTAEPPAPPTPTRNPTADNQPTHRDDTGPGSWLFPMLLTVLVLLVGVVLAALVWGVVS
jgi:hypothetical protein